MTVSQPDVTVNVIPAALNVGNKPQRVLFVGQMTTGTATPGALTSDIQNANDEDTLFGANSLLAMQIRAYKKINKVTQVDAIALDDNGSGVSATGSIVISGTATATGTMDIIVGNSINHKYEITVAVGDTATVVGGKIEAAINADTKAQVTASNSTGTVTLTVDNAGEEGNNFTVKSILNDATGISQTVTGFSGGAANPSLTGLFDPIENIRYQTYGWPSTYDVDVLTTETEARFNVTNNVLDGVGIVCKQDTFANFKTFVEGENNKTLVPFLNSLVAETEYKGGAIKAHPSEIMAQIVAIRSLRLTEDANISQYVISTNGARDSFGGTALASFPYFNTPFPNLPTIEAGFGLTREEIEQLHDEGGSILGNNIAGTDLIMGEVVTTYKTDVAGNEDPSFKYLNYVDTSVNAREYFFNNLRRRFAQSRLTGGDLVPRRSMANKQSIETYLDSLYNDLAGPDYVLTQAGEEALQFFRSNRDVTLDLAEGKVIINMQIPLVVQLRTIVATMQIAFSTQS